MPKEASDFKNGGLQKTLVPCKYNTRAIFIYLIKFPHEIHKSENPQHECSHVQSTYSNKNK